MDFKKLYEKYIQGYRATLLNYSTLQPTVNTHDEQCASSLAAFDAKKEVAPSSLQEFCDRMREMSIG